MATCCALLCSLRSFILSTSFTQLDFLLPPPPPDWAGAGAGAGAGAAESVKYLYQSVNIEPLNIRTCFISILAIPSKKIPIAYSCIADKNLEIAYKLIKKYANNKDKLFFT